MSSEELTSSTVHPGHRAFLARGSTVGRYVILELIGSGGIGVVYSAYDPKLDRKVAIKLLRSGRPPVVDDDLHRRMLREAKAMARLSHRNVVPVHDVGTVGSSVFIAMEYVQGCTLRTWLQKKREPSEILRVFMGAGWGLAAANAAGIIHRDFKPDNVLVGEDGRVQVTDFGLARALMESTVPSVARWRTEGGLDSTGDLTDGPVGTPGYMAPEQFDGTNIDSRADQFSFCVALYEALYRQRPFEGATLPELMQNLRSGKVRESSKDAHVPQRLRRVLLKGLSPQPSNRYPSIEALLNALAKNPRTYWHRAGLALAGLTMLAAVGWTYQSTRAHQQQLCRSAGGQLQGVWDADVKRKVKQAFLGSGQSYAQTTWNTVENLLDGYARNWSTVHANACEATHVRKEQPEVVYGLQLVCLEHRLQQAKALTQLFSQADKLVVENAVKAVAALPNLKPCADVQAVGSSIATPTDPLLRNKVEQLRAKLAEAEALASAGRYVASTELAQQAVTQSTELSYRPVEAEALYAWGYAEQKLEHFQPAHDALIRAVWSAEAVAGLDELQAKCWLVLALLAINQGQPLEAHALAQHAVAISERLGRPSDLELSVHKLLGILNAKEKKNELALAEFQKALGFAGLDQPENFEVGYLLDDVGAVYHNLGQYQRSADYAQRALHLLEKVLGNQHPAVAAPVNNLSTTYSRLGRFDEAVQLQKRNLAICRETFGEQSRCVAQAFNNLGTIYGRWGRFEEAKESYEKSIAAYETSMGPEFHDLRAPLEGLGSALLSFDDPAQALRLFRRALAITEKTWGTGHQDNAIILTDIGEALLKQHQPHLAIKPLERALKLLEGARLNPPVELALARFALSRALWESDADGSRAKQLALLAWKGMSSAEEKPSELADLQAWLAARGWQSPPTSSLR